MCRPEKPLELGGGQVPREEEALERQLRPGEGSRVDQVREPAADGVHDQQYRERDEVGEILPRLPEYQSRYQQDEEIAIGRQPEAQLPDGKPERNAQRRDRYSEAGPRQVWARWAPAALGLALLGIAFRVPFLDAPLTSDEGGYAEVARLWARGHGLYGSNWVDRPQGLLIVFRFLLSAGITTSVGLRLFAALLAAVLVLLAVSIGALTGGTLSGLVAGALTATAGASPFIEGFTLSGELIASVLTAAAVLAFVLYQPSERLGWLVLAGLAAGSAWMVKQSFFDAAVAIAVCLWGSWRRAALFALAVLVPVLTGVIGSGDPAAWYRSVIGYGLNASGGESPWQRATHLGSSLLPASKALLAVAILAALGWPRAPKLLRIWLVAAAVGVLVGGNVRPHYYLQLVAPLALVAAFVRAAPRVRVALAAAAAAAAVLFAVPLWGATDIAQARTIWPADRHLQSDAEVARYLESHTSPSQRIYVLWAAADLYYLADRAPMSRYLWLRNVQTIHGAVAGIRRQLAAGGAELVVGEQSPSIADPSGQTAAVLRSRYRLVAKIHNVAVYRFRGSP
jgi:hypothetical protein